MEVEDVEQQPLIRWGPAWGVLPLQRQERRESVISDT